MTEGQGGGIPAGWYPDPEGNGERWWNGVSWGELRPMSQAARQQDPPGQHAQRPYGQQSQQQPHGQQPEHPQHQAHPPAAPAMRCVHCQWTDFAPADFVLTPGGTVFDRGIGMATAQCLICRRCGFIHWFATR